MKDLSIREIDFLILGPFKIFYSFYPYWYSPCPPLAHGVFLKLLLCLCDNTPAYSLCRNTTLVLYNSSSSSGIRSFFKKLWLLLMESDISRSHPVGQGCSFGIEYKTEEKTLSIMCILKRINIQNMEGNLQWKYNENKQPN